MTLESILPLVEWVTSTFISIVAAAWAARGILAKMETRVAVLENDGKGQKELNATVFATIKDALTEIREDVRALREGQGQGRGKR